MNVFVRSGNQYLVAPAHRDTLLRLKRQGHDITRIEMTDEEASKFMVELEDWEFEGWVQFSTIMGIPFSIVKEAAACYSI